MRNNYGEIQLDDELHQSVLDENIQIQEEHEKNLKEEEDMSDLIQGE
ncbi:hypothetical protein HQ585_13000 [candidate division KSB1 bacterium]|nr:hypothetical protein [candidate division KSB1 bacterium]